MKAKLILIEDDISIAMLLRTWIQKHSPQIELITAGTLESGLFYAQQAGVIILDLGLPDSPTPQSTLNSIQDLSKHAPVIVLTGLEEPVPPQDSTLLGDAVAVHGADSCLFKSMVMKNGWEGVDLLMFFVQSAAHRRAFQNKNKT
jgi:DNA-binding NarL/FixJ family response regulator